MIANRIRRNECKKQTISLEMGEAHWWANYIWELISEVQP